MRRTLAATSGSRMQSPTSIRPASTAPADIVQRFLDHQQLLIRHFTAMSGCDVRQVITSPFAGFITYTFGDACEISAGMYARRNRSRPQPGFRSHRWCAA